MHPLAARVLGTIRRHDLVPRGARLLTAVSGGSDSVGMLFLLRELESEGELVCAGIAHVNHQLRESAARDEAYCVDLAARLAQPIAVERIDVAALAQRGTSLEDAARTARYAFLRDAMGRFDAVRVAVGHTRDDQAETYLMRVIRGAGPRGLRGIHPRRGAFVRPVLDLTREELREYLAARGVSFCHDETNDDVSFTRNRVRHELLPLLRERFSPSIVDVLARNAEIAVADDAYLTSRVQHVFDRIVRVDGDGERVVIDAGQLAAEPPAIAWRIAHDAMLALHTPPRHPGLARGFSHAQAIVDLAVARDPRRVDVPGIRAERIASEVVLLRKAGRGIPAGNRFQYKLSIPGEVWLAEAGCAVTAEPASGADGQAALDADKVGGQIAIVAAGALSGPLIVRNRRQGDAFRPLGLGGRKKLQDLFVDRKVARTERDRVPVIVDDRDRIVWVAGHAISEEFRVPDGAQAVVILRLKTMPQSRR